MKPNTLFSRLALFVVPLVLLFLVSACGAAPEKLASAQPLPAPVETAAVPVMVETIPVSSGEPTTPLVTVNLAPVAQDFTAQVVAAQAPSVESPWWEVMPEYTLLTLQGYPVSDHLMKPQIFVFPVEELDVNEVAGQAAAHLQSLLQDHREGDLLPYLPPYNAGQVLHAQVKYLDFASGQGLRFLTQFNQGLVPVNNHQLLYTYQGLSSDGKYYLAAVLPVNLAGLPAGENTADIPAGDFINDHSRYLSETAAMLDQQAAGAYTPDLSVLDAMIQSIEIK